MSNLLRRRAHPLLLEIAVRPWLERLARTAGGTVGFADVPDAELARIRASGFDGVWLMGVWPTGPKARRLALYYPDLLKTYEAMLPDWEPRDVQGSPYSIVGYEPLASAGGRDGLRVLRERMATHGLGLMLDFVPNHLGIDHPWLDEHPDRLLRGTARDLSRDPGNWFVHTTPAGEDRIFAHGRDPYFPGWSDTVQMDYRRRETRAAMTRVLLDVASQADGIRCDVAMLPLPDVFAKTWGDGPPEEAGDFWAEAIAALRRDAPRTILMAEVYWGLGPRLRSIGFDWVYDKELLDALIARDVSNLRARFAAPATDHAGFVRFLENHDEPRALETLGARERASAVLALGLPGVRFVFDGQVEGARGRPPVQISRLPAPVPDAARARFYADLLRFLDDPALHEGSWMDLSPALTDGAEASALFASRWSGADGQRILLANLEEAARTAHLVVSAVAGTPLPAAWADAATGERLAADAAGKLDVPLDPWGHRLLRSA
jgi:glycosidase